MSGLIKKKILKVEQQIVAQPHSREAEEAILGCILLKSELFGEVKEFIPKTEVFYYDTSQIVWEKMKELIDEHKNIEPISIISRLNKEEKSKVTGYYLTGLCNGIATTATVINYATIILEKYLQRELISATYKIQKSAFENNTEFESLLKFIKKTTDELTSLTPSKDPTLDQIVNQTIESIESSGNYVKFGFRKLDNLAGGMTKGEITVIAGRPSHGKTTFAINLVKNFIDQGLRVLVVNREMTNIEMMKKLIVLESGKLSYSDVRMNNMNDQSYEELVAVNKKIVDKYTNRLFMCDTARDLTASTAQIMKHSPDVVIDDYIQLIKMDGYDQRRFELETVMNEYKWLAKTYKIVPILISQLNRDIEKRIDPVPKMSDLAESGSIEQVSENVLFVYYDYKVNYEESEIGKDQIQIVAAKVRYGENRKLLFGFNGDKALFHENINNDKEGITMVAKDDEEIKDMLTRVKQMDFTTGK
jgi:replicative DNA helicase